MFRTVSSDSGVGFDVCVIGSGPAGLAVAIELSRAGRSVLILEAGSEQLNTWKHPIPEDELDAERPYRDVPIDGQRSFGFGGTIAQWGAAVGGGHNGVRMVPWDALELGERSWVPLSGWPVSRETFDKYVAESHRLWKMGVPDYDYHRWENKKFKALDLADDGFTTGMYHFVNATPALDEWRAELGANPKVTISVDTLAIKLLPAPGGTSVGSVAVVLPDGKRAEVSARQYVVAAGGIENPRLLLDSSVDGESLAINQEYLGRCFMDHPLVRTGVLELAPGKKATDFGLYDMREVNGSTVMGHIKPTPELAAEHSLMSTAFLLYPRPAGYRPDAMRHYRRLVEANEWREVLRSSTKGQFIPKLSDVTSILRMRKVGRADLGHGGWTSWPGTDENFRVFEILQQTEQPPERDNRVELTAKVDSVGRRVGRLVWSWTWQEVESLYKVQEMLGKALANAGLGTLTLERTQDEPSLLGGTHHHMGATRMSADPALGVVDPECKVHGIDNLHVAGCSVFPVGGYQNPTIPMTALAIRLGQRLGAAAS